MTPADFMAMKAGQRLLVLQKCLTVVADDDRRLEAARIEFLTLMTTLGIYLEAAQYERVVTPAIKFGYGVLSPDGTPKSRGNFRLREALNTAAKTVGGPNHNVIVKALLSWLGGIDALVQKNWFYHSVRQLLNALLASQFCADEDAPLLAEKLALMDELQRAHNHESEAEYAEDLIGR
ncbi:MAG: hypothetical protein HYX69_07150 [Planctomycetia bacterium]|nr:hypothetical protein [Planctomycetia bacterium]